MDAFNDDDVETLVFMKSAQVGATECINNIIGYLIDNEPCPMLVVHPILEMGRAWSKDRLSTMLRDTPCLQGKIIDRRTRDSDNTILHKVFAGGHLTIAGANSPASLASRPVKVVLADEVDRFPPSAGDEGDPLSLAFKRTTTFHNRKHIVVSTPTVRGQSRIEQAFNMSDQQYYYVPCPECGEYQRLRWKNVTWPKDEPEKAGIACEECGVLLTEADKPEMLANGEWRPEGEFKGTRGFHINELYSPFSTFADVAIAHQDAKDAPETLKTWVNTVLGETWVEAGEELDQDAIQARAHDYDKPPDDVLVLTCAVDVQDDRLEAEVKGWGEQFQSWAVCHKIFWGDPGRTELWKRLDELLAERFTRDDGQKLKIAATTIDSGGHFTDQVYKYCRGKRRVYAIKGVGGVGRPVIGRPSRSNKSKVNVWPLGVDTIKEIVFARLQIEQPGPGFCHFPESFDDEWFLQLTAERRVEIMVKGQPSYRWKRLRKRNEAWDLQVYNVAAIELLNPNFEALAKRFEPDDDDDEPPPETERRRIVPRRRGSNWVNYRR